MSLITLLYALYKLYNAFSLFLLMPKHALHLAERLGSVDIDFHHDGLVVAVLADHHGHEASMLLVQPGKVVKPTPSQAPSSFQLLPQFSESPRADPQQWFE